VYSAFLFAFAGRYTFVLRAALAVVVVGILGNQSIAQSPATQPAITLTRIQSEKIPESSGVVASRQYPGVYWTINDSGNPPSLFAMNRTGEILAEFPVKRSNRDWEDLSIDDAGHLYIAEIGNNGGRFGQVAVYRVDEPDPHRAGQVVEPVVVNAEWQLRFPGKPFDAESLFILKDTAYIIAKYLDGRAAELYTFDVTVKDEIQILRKFADLPLHAPVTGAAISPDATRVAVVTGLGVYLFRIDKDVATINAHPPAYVVFLRPSSEAVCFDADGILTTSEDKTIAFFDLDLFRFDE